jgi:hypothetical protein
MPLADMVPDARPVCVVLPTRARLLQQNFSTPADHNIPDDLAQRATTMNIRFGTSTNLMWISNVQRWHEKQMSLFYNGYKMAVPCEKASQNKGYKMATPTQMQREKNQFYFWCRAGGISHGIFPMSGPGS